MASPSAASSRSSSRASSSAQPSQEPTPPPPKSPESPELEFDFDRGPRSNAGDDDHGRGESAGLNSMTYVKTRGIDVGFEARCHHPDHQDGKRCRLRRLNTAAGRNEGLTHRMLLQWLWLGRDLASRKDHHDVWRELEASGDIPHHPEVVTEFERRLPAAAGDRQELPKRRRKVTQGI